MGEGGRGGMGGGLEETKVVIKNLQSEVHVIILKKVFTFE
jgi:hypothetical protein